MCRSYTELAKQKPTLYRRHPCLTTSAGQRVEMIGTDNLGEHQLTLDAIGNVRSIRLIEPLCNERAKVVSARAVAFECTSGVVVGWTVSTSQATHCTDLLAGASVRWSQLDHQTWFLRRSSWLQESRHIERPELLAQSATQFAMPSRSPMRLLGAQLMGISPSLLQPGLWEVQSASEAGDDVIWYVGSDQIDFVGRNEHSDQLTSVPAWLKPDSIVHVSFGTSIFQRASFDGWPLAWRRAFTTQMGLSCDAPVNCKSLLPKEVREHPSLSEWTCRAMAVRIQSSATMRRQIKVLACPPKLDGVRKEHLEAWWPRWRNL